VTATSTLSRRLSEFIGVLFFAVALLWLIALATYNPADPAWFFNSGATQPAANLAGRAGAFLAELSFQLVGYAAFLFPVLAAVLGWYRFWCRPIDAPYTKLIGLVLLFASLACLVTLAMAPARTTGLSFEPGGWLGEQLEGALGASFNHTGSLVILLTVFGLSLVLTTQFSFGRLFASIGQAIRSWFGARADAIRAWRDERRKTRQRREIVVKHAKRAASPADAAETPRKAAPPPVPQPAGTAHIDPDAAPPQPRRAPARAAEARPAAVVEKPGVAAVNGTAWAGGRKEPAIKLPPVVSATPPAESANRAPAERKRGGYAFPATTLLDAPRAERKIDERELMESARLLEEKCREFAVAGAVVQIHPGPVVTTFEFKPEAGVKYSKITSLADDLSLAMKAESVLIERLPGKATVGIQIPNQNREQISLREMLDTDEYQRNNSKLTLALGKTIHGEAFYGDLAQMPHLLIAGATGTGKSVAMNAMLTSILFRATPEEVRLILIDPKRLELGMYEEIPHLLTPVVVDPKQAANALSWAVREMEERYKTLAAEGVRNIEQYNRNVKHAAEQRRDAAPDEEEPAKPLPYIVVVIDELADLMMVAGNEVEESIARLAQMARAVGIHLLLATQRPSVDVITGLIKANLPARISFRVSSKIDSRTILDGNGAEQLLGRGDMLFLPPASSRLVRIHGPYISEQESARLSVFLRKQGKPVYDESITSEDKAENAIEFEKDDLYDEAARLVVSTGQASISYLQRRLRVGFSRAARLVDMMEAEGIVSAAMGGKPREVLVDKGYFDEVDQHPR
jgi:DNA segregation ATPase FtsK/SpoIIIE, S-DNA-T family